MTFTEINNQVKKIREQIKKVRFNEALSELENFIEFIGDKELDKEIIALTARYNIEEKEGRLGMRNDYENQNKIIYAITQVLNETKELAIEKATLETGQELERLNEKGSEVINRLEKMSKLMIESRILEMEMFSESFSFNFSPEQREKMKNHLKRFKEFLDRKE